MPGALGFLRTLPELIPGQVQRHGKDEKADHDRDSQPGLIGLKLNKA
jgi:hypothetical protein